MFHSHKHSVLFSESGNSGDAPSPPDLSIKVVISRRTWQSYIFCPIHDRLKTDAVRKGTISVLIHYTALLWLASFLMHQSLSFTANPNPVSQLSQGQLSQGKTCFHYREHCSHCRDPVFVTGISL